MTIVNRKCDKCHFHGQKLKRNLQEYKFCFLTIITGHVKTLSISLPLILNGIAEYQYYN